MARPQRISISPGVTGWDTDVDDNFGAVFDQPFAIVRAADVATLTSTFSAAQYEHCLAIVEGPPVLHMVSDGTNWIPA